MTARIVAAFALLGAILLPASGAQASDTVLDGKTVTSIKTIGSGGMQRHDRDDSGRPSSSPDVCARRGCSTLPFVYAPAEGVRGGVMLTSTWKDPLQDIDLYLVQVDKDGDWKEVGACVGPGSTEERIYLPPSALKDEERYLVIIDNNLSLNDIVTTKAEIDVPSETGTRGCLTTGRPPAKVESGSTSETEQDTGMPFWRSLALLVGGILVGGGLVLGSVWVGRRPVGAVALPHHPDVDQELDR